MDKGCILQWNCRGYYANFSNIKELLDKYNLAIMALQELIMGQRKTLSLNTLSWKRRSGTPNP